MVLFNILPKILYKPREAYEELQDSVTAQEGIFVWVFSAILGLIIYGGAATALGSSEILLGFGLGTQLTVLGIGFGFLQATISLVFIAWIVNKLAIRLGGAGNFGQLLGMLGYSKILGVIRAVFGILILVIMYIRSVQLVNMAMSGAAIPAISIWFTGGLVLVPAAIFLIWEIWIQGNAVSVEHGISFLRAAGLLVFALAITYLLWGGIKLLPL